MRLTGAATGFELSAACCYLLAFTVSDSNGDYRLNVPSAADAAGKSLTLLRPVSHHCRQEVTDKMSSQQPPSQQPPSQQPPSQQPAPVPVPAPASPVERTSVVTEQPRYNFRAAAVVGFIFGAVDILIAARFLGKLLGASSQSAFVHFIYQLSGVMVAPFTGIFGDTGTKTNTFESASLVAIVVYAVIGWGLVVLIRIVTAPKGTKPE